MNKSEIQVIKNVIERLQGKSACSEVNTALTEKDVSLYLNTWVISSLKLLIKDDRSLEDLELAKRLSK
jgi:hypothetical protein